MSGSTRSGSRPRHRPGGPGAGSRSRGVPARGPSGPAREAVISDVASSGAAGTAAGALGRPRSRSIGHDTTISRLRALVDRRPRPGPVRPAAGSPLCGPGRRARDSRHVRLSFRRRVAAHSSFRCDEAPAASQLRVVDSAFPSRTIAVRHRPENPTGDPRVATGDHLAAPGFSDLRTGFVLRDKTGRQRRSGAPRGSGHSAPEHDAGSPEPGT